MEMTMIRLFNMSFAASVTALMVIVLRLGMKRLPKGYSYALWLAVLFRFLCPAVIASPFSLLPVNPEPMSPGIIYQAKPEIETGVIWVDWAFGETVGAGLSVDDAALASANPIQIWMAVGYVLWISGMVLFALYHLIQFWKLKKRLATAVPAEGRESDGAVHTKTRRIYRILESDQISGAFVMGLVRPAIYLPVGLDAESRAYILRHEIVHIRRKDYLVKLAGLVMVGVHWFNPLAWISFRLMCADMEMSCDERVLRAMDGDRRKAYSLVLLSEAMAEQTSEKERLLPLAFGKSHTYLRIRNILAYHKPGLLVSILAAGLLITACTGLVTSKRNGEALQEHAAGNSVSVIGGADGPTSIFLAGKVGDGSEAESFQSRPDSGWLASVRLKWRNLEDHHFLVPGSEAKEQEAGSGDGTDADASEIILDYASDEMVMFHGDFGLFLFQKDQSGRWEQQLFWEDGEMSGQAAEILDQALSGQEETEEAAVSSADRFQNEGTPGAMSSYLNSGQGFGSGTLDYDTRKLADGTIAVLGAQVAGYVEGRLIDLYYGRYDPQEQVMTQVWLFVGDGREVVSPTGEISERRWLFARDGYDYCLRTPQSFLDFEKESGTPDSYHLPYGRLELVRSRDGAEEVLDPLVCIQEREDQKVVVTEDRIVYSAAADGTRVDFKNPGLASCRLDGSDRRTSELRYQVHNGLSYDDGYLYYEGWTNDARFPRPLMRMCPDFTEQEQIGELERSLLEVKNGRIWQLDWQEPGVVVSPTEHPEQGEMYLKNGQSGSLPGDHSGELKRCTMKRYDNGQLQVILTSLNAPYSSQVYWLWLPVGVDVQL